MSDILIKRGNLGIDMHPGRMPCEDEGGDQDDHSTNQKHQILLESHQKLGERHRTDSSSQVSEGTNLVEL